MATGADEAKEIPVPRPPAGNVAATAAPVFVPLPEPQARRREIAWHGWAVGAAALFFLLMFYRLASWKSLRFPPSCDDPLGTCYFPLVGVCTPVECCLLYLNLIAITAVGAWFCARLIATREPSD